MLNRLFHCFQGCYSKLVATAYAAGGGGILRFRFVSEQAGSFAQLFEEMGRVVRQVERAALFQANNVIPFKTFTTLMLGRFLRRNLYKGIRLAIAFFAVMKISGVPFLISVVRGE